MPPKVSRRASKSWAKLGQWYGSRLADNYGPTPPPDWCDVIDRTDDERLDDAMLAVRRESPIHPPTLGQLESKIPAKRLGPATRFSAAEILCEWAVFKLRGALCAHQLAAMWSYFGPSREFVVKHAGGEVVSHPEVRGVVIPECAACSLGTHRVLLDDVPHGFDPSHKQLRVAG